MKMKRRSIGNQAESAGVLAPAGLAGKFSEKGSPKVSNNLLNGARRANYPANSSRYLRVKAYGLEPKDETIYFSFVDLLSQLQPEIVEQLARDAVADAQDIHHYSDLFSTHRQNIHMQTNTHHKVKPSPSPSHVANTQNSVSYAQASNAQTNSHSIGPQGHNNSLSSNKGNAN